MRSESLDQFDDCAYGSCKHDHFAAIARFDRIRDACMNRTHALGARQNLWLIAANDLSTESALAERQTERTADEAGADNRDLANGHEGIESLNHRGIESLK